MASATMENCAAANPDQAPDPGWESTGRVSFAGCERGNSSVGYLVLAALLAGLVAVVTGTLESGAVESASCAIGRAFDPTIQCAAPNGDDRADNGSNPGRESTDFASAASALQDATQATEPPPASTETVFVAPNVNTLPVEITQAQYESLVAAGANPILVTDPHQIEAGKLVDLAKVVSDAATGVHAAWAEMFGEGAITSAVVQEGDAPAQVVLAATETDVGGRAGVVGPEMQSPDEGDLPIAVDADGNPIIRLESLEPGDDGDSNKKGRRSRVLGGTAGAVARQLERDKAKQKQKQYRGIPLFSFEIPDGDRTRAWVYLDPRESERGLRIALTTTTGPPGGAQSVAPSPPRLFRVGPDRRIAGSDDSTLGEVDERGEFTFDPDALVAEAERMRAAQARSGWTAFWDGVWDLAGWEREVEYLGRGRWRMTNPDGSAPRFKGADGVVTELLEDAGTRDAVIEVGSDLALIDLEQFRSPYLDWEAIDATVHKRQMTTHPDSLRKLKEGSLAVSEGLDANPKMSTAAMKQLVRARETRESQLAQLVYLAGNGVLVYDAEVGETGAPPFIMIPMVEDYLVDLERWTPDNAEEPQSMAARWILRRWNSFRESVGLPPLERETLSHAWVGRMPEFRETLDRLGLDQVELQMRNPATDKGEPVSRVEAVMSEALQADITELAVAEATRAKMAEYRGILDGVAGEPITHVQLVTLSEDPIAQLESSVMFRETLDELLQLMIRGEPVPAKLVFWSAGSDLPRVVGYPAAREIAIVTRSRFQREGKAFLVENHDVAVAAFRRQGNEHYASMDPGPERDQLVEQYITEKMTHLGRLANGFHWIGNGTSLARSQPMRYASETAMDFAEHWFKERGGTELNPAYHGYLRAISDNKGLHGLPVDASPGAIAAKAKEYTLAQYQQEFLVQVFGTPPYDRVTMQAATYDQSLEVLGPIQGYMHAANRDIRPMRYTPRMEAAILAYASRLAEDAAAISTGLTGIARLEGLIRSTMPSQENIANLLTHPALVPRAQSLIWERGQDGVWRLPSWQPGASVENLNPRNVRLDEMKESLELILAESESWAVPSSTLDEIQNALRQRIGAVGVRQTMIDEVSPPELEDRRAIPASGGRVEIGGLISGGQIALTMRGVMDGIAIAERIGGAEAGALATQASADHIVALLASEGWRFADIEEGGVAIRSQARLMRGIPFGAELTEQQQLVVDHDVRRVEETLRFYRAFLEEHRPGMYKVLMDTPRARQARQDFAQVILRLHSNRKFVDFVASQIESLEVNEELLKDVRKAMIEYMEFRYIQRAG